MAIALNSDVVNKNLTAFEQLKIAVDVIKTEAESLKKLAGNLPADFLDVVDAVSRCRGSVIVTGMGKAGWIGQKVSASMASTGTRSQFLHPAEAFHGDLGRIGGDDLVLAFSNSGETSEVLQLLPSIQAFGNKIVAVTSNARSTLARQADWVLDYPRGQEAGHLGLAPSTSTTTMLALGDALTLVLSRIRAFRDIDFAKFHPGGSLGRKLALVEEVMRPLSQCRVAQEGETIRDVYVRYSGRERRVGVVLVVNSKGKLTGVFTDSDLARLLESQQDHSFDAPICKLMTSQPTTIQAGSRTELAIELLACKNLSELPVVQDSGKPLGLIDITDVVNI